MSNLHAAALLAHVERLVIPVALVVRSWVNTAAAASAWLCIVAASSRIDVTGMIAYAGRCLVGFGGLAGGVTRGNAATMERCRNTAHPDAAGLVQADPQASVHFGLRSSPGEVSILRDARIVRLQRRLR